jgi:DNA-binding MarR family transcriptional regulator
MGLSLAKMGALQTLVEADGPIPLGQLAERLCCVKSNVTQLVDRLEAELLVRRVPDPADRRSVRAEVTDEGRARFAAAVRAREAAEAELLAGFGADELERLAAWCRRVAGG